MISQHYFCDDKSKTRNIFWSSKSPGFHSFSAQAECRDTTGPVLGQTIGWDLLLVSTKEAADQQCNVGSGANEPSPCINDRTYTQEPFH